MYLEKCRDILESPAQFVFTSEKCDWLITKLKYEHVVLTSFFKMRVDLAPPSEHYQINVL